MLDFAVNRNKGAETITIKSDKDASEECIRVKQSLLQSNLSFALGRGNYPQVPSVTFIVPAFNEEKNIGNVISGIISQMGRLCFPFEIIVVDDCSSDKTSLVASNYGVTLLSNKKNRGKGYCLKKALPHAKGDIIVTMDADGEHNPKEIPALLKPVLSGTDIVAGSRFKNGASDMTTKLNQMGNRMFNIAIMSLTGRQVTDSQTGFRVLKRCVLEEMDLVSDGYEVETEITVKSLKNGFVFVEKPITVERRKHGQSKLRLLSDSRKILQTILRVNFAPINH